jgi:hypothetical protein
MLKMKLNITISIDNELSLSKDNSYNKKIALLFML